jgi:hypothetical protein
MTTWPIQDHFDAFRTLLAAAPGGPPSLTVYDGKVDDGATTPYVLVYFSIATPDGLTAPDAVSLHADSDVIDARAIVHCVGGDPQAQRAARAVAGRVRAAVLNQRLTIAGRDCAPIRWIDGQPPQRNEDVPGSTVFDQVDVYGWRSVPG